MIKRRHRIVLSVLLSVVAGALLIWLLLQGSSIDVLDPKGSIALQQRNLIITATLLTMIVVLPVFALTGFIAWKYRAGNKTARYTPDWDHHRGLEFTWWAIPSAIILVLSVITWNSTHALDPYKPIQSTQPPITIQVVALQWKWLFIYPEQGIATVNQVQFPVNTPINFELTADAPMNSFWIPQLGGQVYAMAGMKTKLHLMASETGNYYGTSANLSGKGFSGMKFIAKASTQTEFDDWVASARQSAQHLDEHEYAKLVVPSENNPPTAYASPTKGLYDQIIMKFMTPHPSGDLEPVHDHGEATP